MKTLEDLQRISDPFNNFKNMRETLSASDPPIIPLLRLFSFF